MISKHDLLYNLDKYKPLSSIKSTKDRAWNPNFTNVNLYSLFYSPENVKLLVRSYVSVARKMGYNTDPEVFAKNIPTMMKRFTSRTDVSKYNMLETFTGSQEIQDFALTLRAINNDFLQYANMYLRPNVLVPTRASTEVGDSENRVMKKNYELTAQDIGTIDVWGRYDINTNFNHYRDNNRIPFYQYTMNSRNMERHNIEGLRNGDPDEASLETPITAYDMGTVYSTLSDYTDTNWFGN